MVLKINQRIINAKRKNQKLCFRIPITTATKRDKTEGQNLIFNKIKTAAEIESTAVVLVVISIIYVK